MELTLTLTLGLGLGLGPGSAWGNFKKRRIFILANRVIEWSRENRVQLNAEKCKELRISFAKEQRVFDPVIIEGKEVELVTSTKLLGLTIANDLT